MITHDNIEEFVIDYLSDELSENDIQELETFLKNNPEYNDLIDSYSKTFVHHDISHDIAFAHKDKLKKHNQSTFWNKKTWKYAASIALIISGAAYMYNRYNQNTTIENIDSPITTIDHNNSIDKKPENITSNSHDEKNQNPIPKPQMRTTQNHITQNRDITSQQNDNESEITPVLDAPVVSKLQPMKFHLAPIQQELVIHTYYISKSDIPDLVRKPTQSDDMELTIGGRTLDVNLNQLTQLRKNIDQVKETITDAVEELPVEDINLWNLITK